MNSKSSININLYIDRDSDLVDVGDGWQYVSANIGEFEPEWIDDTMYKCDIDLEFIDGATARLLHAVVVVCPASVSAVGVMRGRQIGFIVPTAINARNLSEVIVRKISRIDGDIRKFLTIAKDNSSAREE